jgi:putative tryptophan/tyrosine transport system substrate-binding protein
LTHGTSSSDGVRMRRREVIAALGAASVGWAVIANAQPRPLLRIAILMGVAESDPEGQARLSAFRRGLEEAGWLEGRNLQIERRWGSGEPAAFRAYAAELVSLRPEAILANTPPAVSALRAETTTIPIVFTGVSSPVDARFVESVARPGANVTGFSTFDPAMAGKWVELLKEVSPGLARVAVLFNPQTTTARGNIFLPAIKAAVGSIPVDVLAVGDADEMEKSVFAFARHPAGGLIVGPDPFTTTHRQKISALASHHKLPAVYPYRWFAAAGGLISYGTDVLDQFRRAGGYIDRILKGEKAGELPVQAPSKFELVLNLGAARALDLAVPPTLLARADEVIE